MCDTIMLWVVGLPFIITTWVVLFAVCYMVVTTVWGE
jgi:hypothetical protein